MRILKAKEFLRQFVLSLCADVAADCRGAVVPGNRVNANQTVAEAKDCVEVPEKKSKSIN